MNDTKEAAPFSNSCRHHAVADQAALSSSFVGFTIATATAEATDDFAAATRGIHSFIQAVTFLVRPTYNR